MKHSDRLNAVETKLTNEQIQFIQQAKLRRSMEITVTSTFDTPYVTTDKDRWEFTRLGTTQVNIFDEGQYFNKLLKLLAIKYSDSHMAPLDSSRFQSIKKRLRQADEYSFSAFYHLLDELAKSNQAKGYFELKAITKYLIRMRFPGFGLDDEEKLDQLAVPDVNDPFLRYQDAENTLPSHIKNLIVKKMTEYSTQEGLNSLSDVDVKNMSVLGLSYSVGCRSAQYSMLQGNSVRLIAKNHKTNLRRFEVSVPLAKQIEIKVTNPKIALSQEVGLIVQEYMNRFEIGATDPLFPFNSKTGTVLSVELHKSLNEALLFIQPDDAKEKIRKNEMDRPIYTLYDFRHNIGHTMAMNNASAQEIAFVLGHTSLVAARHYIMSTPELALLKNQSLGQNPIWKDMIGLLMTGYKTEESTWGRKTVSGILNGKFIHRIGGCERRQHKCHLAKVRSCYGCFYFRPFTNLSKHNQVLDIISEEFVELVKISNDAGINQNPLITTITETKNEIEMVISRLEGGLR
ncbi:Tyr recombinase domain-containing protein [Vibrio crassostreae]|nr:Tyr recombinase domain-containing protein [Vibrio crassostreae]